MLLPLELAGPLVEPSGAGVACGVAGSAGGLGSGVVDGIVVVDGEDGLAASELPFGAGLLQAAASNAPASTIGMRGRWIMSFSARMRTTSLAPWRCGSGSRVTGVAVSRD